MSLNQPRFGARQSGRIGSGLVFGAFALIALFFLWTEHRAHLFGALPFLLLLACPLLHVLHGHGGHHHDAGGPQPSGRDPAAGSDDPAAKAPPSSPSHRHH